jgi:hypothetical protein
VLGIDAHINPVPLPVALDLLRATERTEVAAAIRRLDC